MNRLFAFVFILFIAFTPECSIAAPPPPHGDIVASNGTFTPATIRKVEAFFKKRFPNNFLLGVWNASAEGLKREFSTGGNFFSREKGDLILLWNGHICIYKGGSMTGLGQNWDELP